MTDLGSYLPRLCRWPALAIGVGLAWALTWWRVGEVTTELDALWLMRFAAVIASVAATFALDDPSFDVTRPTVGLRRSLMPARLTAAVGTVAVGVIPAGLVAVGELSARTWWGLVLEVTALVALLCGVHLLLQQRWRFSEPAQFMVFVVVLLGLYEQLTLGRWPLLAAPGAAWDDAHQRWVILGALAAGLLAWQLRDPASARPRAVFAGRRGRAARAAGVASRREHSSS